MRKEAKVLLGVLRLASKRDVEVPLQVVLVLREVLAITDRERNEIGEILVADLRELNATYPGFDSLKDRIKQIIGE